MLFQGAISKINFLPLDYNIGSNDFFQGKSLKFMKYHLKHKDINVLEMEIDEFAKITKICEVINKNHIPYFIDSKNKETINHWLKLRSIPFSRENVEKIIEIVGLQKQGSQGLLLKCLGLSLSDAYWICPKNKNLK